MSEPTPPRRRRVAPYLLVALVATGAIAHATGLVSLEPEALVAAVRAAGPWGVVLLIAAFAVGTAANVPGFLFIGASVAVYGPCFGYVIALVGAIASVNVGFGLGRLAGFGDSKVLERPWIQKVVGRLESRPVLAMVLLRTVVMVSPPINYALALTSLRPRDHALGSALGLAIPVWVVAQGAGLML